MATVFKPKRSEVALSIPAAGSLAVGELAMNITDGKFYTKTTGGTVKEVGATEGGKLNSALGEIISILLYLILQIHLLLNFFLSF